MSQDAVIEVIGDHGWMGQSLGTALLERDVVPAGQLVVSSRSGGGEAYRDWPEVRCVKDNRELVACNVQLRIANSNCESNRPGSSQQKARMTHAAWASRSEL